MFSLRSSDDDAMSAKQILTIRQEEDHGRYRLVLSGELDLQGAPSVEAAITRLCKAGAIEIEIDLRDLWFIDSSGLQALLRARQLCAQHNCEFFLMPGRHPGPRRLFEIMRLDDALPWREADDPQSEDTL
jgi:anti-anti-sigma factor